MMDTSLVLRSIPGPDDILRTVLPNGIVILCRHNPASPSVVLSGYFQAGSLFEQEDKLGLANFTASALLRGTRKRDFQSIFNELESCGASLSFHAGVHTSGFGGRALAEDLPLLLDIMSDALRFPTFPPEYVEKLRAQLLTGLAIRAQDTADMACLTFDQILYADHPYRHPEGGWPETIQAIRRDDLAHFHQMNYGPRGLVLALVGAIEARKAAELVRQMLGDWQNPLQRELGDLPPLKPLKRTARRQIRISGKTQSDIVMGSTGPRRKDPDYYSASLANSILGEFGMMGRIGDSVREKEGLAYYAFSSLSAGVGPGSWTVHAGVNPANVEKAARLVKKEITRFVEEGVTQEELGDNQANYIGRMPLSLESNAGVANSLLNIERYDLGLDYLHRYPQLVGAVTTESIRQVAEKYLDVKRLAFAVAGP